MNLEVLLASNNDFKSFKNISSLTTLKLIDLEDNRIRDIAVEDFEGLIQLKQLFLSSNGIKLKGSQFSKLTNLKNLYLYDNELKYLNLYSLQGLPNLVHLSLERNFIETLDYVGLAQALPSLETLRLYGNPMPCAIMSPMSQFLKKKGNITVDFLYAEGHHYNYYVDFPEDFCDIPIIYYGIISWMYLLVAFLITVFIYFLDRLYKTKEIFDYKEHETDENKLEDEEEIV